MVAAKTPAAKTPAKKKPAAKKKPLAPIEIPAAPPPEALPDVPMASADAYKQYLPLAQALPAETVATYNQNPALAYQNIQKGIAALAPHGVELKALPAPFDHTLMQALPAVALGLIYAAAQVDATSPGTIAQLRKTASALRDLLLSSAAVLAKAGLIPADEVRRIQKGTGAVDGAQDCIDLAELFTSHAKALSNKTAITQEHIDQAQTVGNQLITMLKAKNSPKETRSERYPAVAARDRMGALLTSWHEQHLRRAGYWIWGRDIDDHVPPLHSHEPPPKETTPKTGAKGKAVKDTGAGASARGSMEPGTD